MLTLYTGDALLSHQLVDAVAAALAGTGQAAAAHDNGNLVGADTVTLHHVEYGTLAIVELVGHLVELLYLLNGVGEVFSKYLILAVIDSGLGRCGTRVDYQRVFSFAHSFYMFFYYFSDCKGSKKKRNTDNYFSILISFL
jgi:hypothetical protein